jgi:hypothetical protein
MIFPPVFLTRINGLRRYAKEDRDRGKRFNTCFIVFLEIFATASG